MAADDKGHAALLLALGAPKGMSKGDADDSDDGDDMEATAAQDVMDAVKERDVKSLQDALHRFVVACTQSYDKSDDDEAPSSSR